MLAGISSSAWAQKSASDTVLSNGLRIGFDLGRVANYYIQNHKNFSLEGSADIGYQRWLGVVELGYGNVKDGRTDVYSYNSNGAFARIGIERNLLKGGDDVVFWGLRYGIGRVSYEYSFYNITDPVWGNTSGSVPKIAAMQHWSELVGGIKAEVLKNIYLGFTLRFRVKLSGNYNTDMAPISVPGYGSALKNTGFGANYYISYRIPFKKPATFPKKPKIKKSSKKAEPNPLPKKK